MMDLAKVQIEIEKGFKEGLEDSAIGKKLNIPEAKITMIRTMLGLKYSWAVNCFEESRKVIWDEATELFSIGKFTIPNGAQEKIQLKDNKNYQFIASVIKPKTIQITFLENIE